MVVICIVALPKFKSIQKMVDKLNLVTRESLTGMMVIRAFGTQKNEEERFDKANKDLTSVNLFVNRVMVILMPIITLIMNGVTLLIVWVGAHQIEAAQIQIGDMMAFMQYGMIIIMAFLMISMMFIMIPRASVSASRIAEVLESELSIKDSKNPKSLGENSKGEISFNNVSFKYGNAEDNVIENISFTAKPGQTTAFIGSTGSGKSTTLAALLNEINKNKSRHIITIEDPVEFIHTPKHCIINQREIGLDCQSYANALRAAMREDPDIILLGELRDRETMSTAMTAVETGHLVFSTVHTEGAAKTIDRLIDIFPADQQQQIRVQLSTSLKAVISQRLLPRATGGRVAAFEMMFVTKAISNLIRENKTANIDQSIQLGSQTGMITMKKSIEGLLKQGIITAQTAKAWSFDIGETDQLIT